MNGLFNSSKKLPYPKSFGLIILASISLTGFLLASKAYHGIGFPLDDAWIHQTYARNLALTGEWAFIPGQPSAGSTSPLWTIILAAGYHLNIQPILWASVMGGLCLAGIAWAAETTFRSFNPGLKYRLPFVAVLFGLEWHLVWAAGSGMETPLYALLVLLVFVQLFRPEPNWLIAGSLVGLSVWVRPDGITLVGPLIFVLVFTIKSWRGRLRSALFATGPFLVLFLAYMLFTHALAGTWWPNTFYAKQAEYTILNQFSLAERIGSLLKLPLVGVGALLAPCIAWMVWKGWRTRSWPVLAAFLWWFGFTLLYAWRLPVTYQHGRYLIPSMTIFFLLGVLGLADLRRNNLPVKWSRILGQAWIIACGIVLILFYLLGAQAYAQDVAIIDTEMVATAHWISNNTPPQALLAAHDIGALGYFGNRRLIDLAGLISPEVIPIIRDEERLGEYLNVQKVDYLVTFPDWYPDLIKHGKPVFNTNGGFAPILGGENMVVYQWLLDK